jgi:D,D-heptose 1,7-bisphosphate phosphatase
MRHPGVFLDRDGVLIRDVHLLITRDEVDIFPYVSKAINCLHQAGYIIVVVSNQPVIARGLITEQGVADIHLWIQDLLRQDNACIDRFYFCPHHPKADLVQYRFNCECRKPRPGMLLQAAEDLAIDLKSSFMIGDRPSDIVAGHSAGCRTILVETGMHTNSPIESSHLYNLVDPDYICSDLMAATDIILGR